MAEQRTSDVIVIGGGMAGLAAAGELGRRGHAVILLEARKRLGGRVYTERRRGWKNPIELGAQFVHGGNDAIWKLIREHRIATPRVPGGHWRRGAGGFEKVDATDDIAAVTEKIDAKRMKGWSFARFLHEFEDEFTAEQRRMAVGFVEGFEAAPCAEMSAVAVAGETLVDDEQHLLPRGSEALVTGLASRLDPDCVRVFVDAACTAVEWRRGHVEVRTHGNRFTARAVIVALPLGVLQAAPDARGAIAFTPGLGRHQRTIAAMRTGHVIRINLRFAAAGWRKLAPKELARGKFGFLHADSRLPVWWNFGDEPVITGWAGGPDALALSRRPDAAIVRTAIAELASILQVPGARLRAAVADAATHNWSRDPFSRGAYSFTRAGHDDAAEKLRTPVKDTLFFAGEATAEGEEVGTMHGALDSGLRAAKEAAAALR